MNTHANGDHCYGNELVPDRAEIYATVAATEEMDHFPAARIDAMKQADDDGLREFAQYAFGDFEFGDINGRKPDRTFTGSLSLEVGGRNVEVTDLGPAHTLSDSVVHVPDARTVFTGDLVFVEGTPIAWAGPVDNWLAACERICALDVDIVVPGHGPLTDAAGVRDVGRYFTYVQSEAAQRQAGGMGAWRPRSTSTSASSPTGATPSASWSPSTPSTAGWIRAIRRRTRRSCSVRCCATTGSAMPRCGAEADLTIAGGRTLPGVLRAGADRHPDRELLVFDPLDGPATTYSWAEVLRSSEALAAQLAALGVGRGDAVHLHLANRPEFLFAWFAAAHLGARIVPTNTAASSAELAYIVGHAEARVSLTDAPASPPCRPPPTGSRSSCDGDLQLAARARIDAVAAAGDDLAVMYTSGTTSRPQGRAGHARQLRLRG